MNARDVRPVLPLGESRSELTKRIVRAMRSHVETKSERCLTQPVIRLLEVQQFRNIETAKLTLDQITVLVGENNSGKTNLLTAIACVFPQVFAERSDIFAADFGSGGLIGSTGTNFIRYGFSPAYTAIGVLTDEGMFYVSLNAGGIGNLLAAWHKTSGPVAALFLRSDLRRRRWFTAPWGRLDGRRLGPASGGELA